MGSLPAPTHTVQRSVSSRQRVASSDEGVAMERGLRDTSRPLRVTGRQGGGPNVITPMHWERRSAMMRVSAQKNSKRHTF
mmetsp:Transcript_37342/g.99298  ORF Transcript_37342/g.99298 Transcript_37342/m.99298 type:complete len:80 (-) Transcript_37342:28-267(-)